MNPDFGTPSLSFVETFSGVGEWPASTELIPPQDFSSGVSTSFVEDFSGVWSASTELIPPQDFSSVSTSFVEDFSGVWASSTELIPPQDFSVYSQIFTDNMDWAIQAPASAPQEINAMAKRLYLKPAGASDVSIADLGLHLKAGESVLAGISDIEALDTANGEIAYFSAREIRQSASLRGAIELLSVKYSLDGTNFFLQGDAGAPEAYTSEMLLVADLSDDAVTVASLISVAGASLGGKLEAPEIELGGADLRSELDGHDTRLDAEEAVTAQAIIDRAADRAEAVAGDAVVNAAVLAEATTARAAESAIATDLAAEAVTARAAEVAAEASAAAALAAAGAEATRAVAAEAAEALARGNADSALQTRATDLESDVATLNHPSAAGSVAKAVQEEQNRAELAEAANASALVTLNGSGAGSVAAAVDTEKLRAEAAEAILQGGIDLGGSLLAGAEASGFGVAGYKSWLTTNGLTLGAGSLVDLAETNESGVAAIEADIGDDSTAGSIKGKIKAVEDDVVLINAKDNAQDVSIAGLAGDVSAAGVARAGIDIRLDALEGAGTAQTATNANISTRADNADSERNAFGIDISALNTAKLNIISTTDTDRTDNAAARAVIAQDVTDNAVAINTLQGTVTAIMDGSSTNLNAFKEVADAFQLADSNLNGAISALATEHNTELATEVGIARAAEAAIAADLVTEAATARAAEQANAAGLVSEASTARAAEVAAEASAAAALLAANNEASRAATAENDLDDKIDALKGADIALTMTAGTAMHNLYNALGVDDVASALEAEAANTQAGGVLFHNWGQANGFDNFKAIMQGAGISIGSGSLIHKMESAEADIVTNAAAAAAAQSSADSEAIRAAAAEAANGVLISSNASDLAAEAVTARAAEVAAEASAAAALSHSQAEATRAAAAEGVNSVAIVTEKDRAEAAEAVINAAAAADAAALVSEAATARAAEQAAEASAAAAQADVDSAIAAIAVLNAAAGITGSVLSSITTASDALQNGVIAGNTAANASTQADLDALEALFAARKIEHRTMAAMEDGYASSMSLSQNGQKMNLNSERFSADCTLDQFVCSVS